MKKYNNFNDFYPFYLSEHMDPICRVFHFIGTLGVIVIIALSFYNIKLLLLAPILGYGFAWAGHFFSKKIHQLLLHILYIVL